jgi:hypothetical protein
VHYYWETFAWYFLAKGLHTSTTSYKLNHPVVKRDGFIENSGSSFEQPQSSYRINKPQKTVRTKSSQLIEKLYYPKQRFYLSLTPHDKMTGVFFDKIVLLF